MSRPVVLVGCWPRRMNAELAAAYCGEPSAKAFLKKLVPSILSRVSATKDAGYGFGTISIKRSYHPTYSRSGTSPRICDRDPVTTPFRCRQNVS